jgi:hypothetical protein
MSMKSEISKLEEERVRLMEVLANHALSCTLKQPSNNNPSVIIANTNNNNPSLPSYGGGFTVINNGPGHGGGNSSWDYRQQIHQQQQMSVHL